MALAGEVYMQNNEPAKATGFFERAAKLDPANARTRTGLALSRLATGDRDDALADLESAVQLDAVRYQADVLLVMAHLRRENYGQALEAMQTLEKKQPNNPLTYNLKAAIYIAKKDTASARKNLERALELQATYVPAAINLAQLDLREKNPQSARKRLEGILEKDKDNAQALLALASLAPRIGASQKERIMWLERARKAAPGSVHPQLTLARIYAQSGDAKKALEVAQEAQTISPDNPQVLGTLAAAQIGAGEKSLALTTYRRLVELQPKSWTALYGLAAAQVANANPAEAVSALKRALALKPDFVAAQAALVGLELRAGRFPEAMKIAQQVQKQNAKSAVGFMLEGDVLSRQKQFSRAAKAYENAYGITKSGALAIKLHSAYAQAGKPDEGDARLAQWLKESPNDNVARLYAAESDLKRGRYKEAIANYELLQQKQLNNIVLLNNLAWAYQQVKDRRALETAERAYKLKPDMPGVADTLGYILIEMGDTKRGLELLQQAVANAPKNPALRYHLAQGWFKAGDKAKARDELTRLLSTDAKFPERAEAVKLLRQLNN
jgi:putative PEP-CTERM system TPR-repeat lipoprotein